MNKQSLTNPENLKRSQYEHGGCRIYFESGDDRTLVVDGHMDEVFADSLERFVRGYYGDAAARAASISDKEDTDVQAPD